MSHYKLTFTYPNGRGKERKEITQTQIGNEKSNVVEKEKEKKIIKII